MIRRRLTTRNVAATLSVAAVVLVLLLVIPILKGARLETRRFEGPSSSARPLVGMSIDEPTEDASEVLVTFHGVVLPAGFRIEGGKFCVEDIDVLENVWPSAEEEFWDRFLSIGRGSGSGSSGGRGQSPPPEELDCVLGATVGRDLALHFPVSLERERRLRLIRDSSYKFPFDVSRLDIEMVVSATGNPTQASSRLRVAPRIVTLISAPNWDVNATVAIEEGETHLQIVYRRPLVYRVLVPTILLLAVGLILSLLRVETFETLLRVTPALLFGLWGVREVLVPDTVRGHTWIDGVLLVLYAYLAVVFAIRTLVMLSPKPRSE